MTVGTYLYSFPFYGVVRIMVFDGVDADGTAKYAEACTECLVNTKPTSLDLLAEKEISSACVCVLRKAYILRTVLFLLFTRND